MSVTVPRGFRAAGVAAGIRPGRDDLALLAADRLGAAAGVFTSNRAAAAPVLVSRAHLAGGRARAVICNAGCANAATGPRGLADAREMAALTATALGCAPAEVLVASTGVIGVPLPMDAVRAGIPRAVAALSPEGGPAAAGAILTTDTRAKQTLVEVRVGRGTVRIGGMAKGAGMIAPRLGDLPHATMLAFLTTDAAIDPALLQRALAGAAGETFNRITVDGDTSTNDTVLVLASGAADAPPVADGESFEAFRAGLTAACDELAHAIVRDGEGATRVAEVRVTGAASPAEADLVARLVAESPLVKTALHGGDPNWGRILAAAGRAGVDLGRAAIWLGTVAVAAEGAALPYAEADAHAQMVADPARIRIDLGRGDAVGWMWTTDLGHGYVDVNAHYRS